MCPGWTFDGGKVAQLAASRRPEGHSNAGVAFAAAQGANVGDRKLTTVRFYFKAFERVLVLDVQEILENLNLYPARSRGLWRQIDAVWSGH
jgi:hypothetical protein